METPVDQDVFMELAGKFAGDLGAVVAADVHIGCEQFFRAGYAAHVVVDWLPALDAWPGSWKPGAGSRTWARP